MLRILLDEHISPIIGKRLRAENKDLVVNWMAEWQGGRFLGIEDSIWLGEAQRGGFSTVTYDRRTIPPLLKTWAEEGRSHGGIIFVDDRTIAPADLGGLLRALTRLWLLEGEADWVNRIYYLQR
jgi:hypothetical protein